MSKIAYEDWRPSPRSAELVDIAEAICAEYARAGYDLTLRQLYYQFVARDVIANNQASYDSLGSVVDRARKAGLLDWDYIVDRTRNLRGLTNWRTPSRVIAGAASSYHLDHWEGQPARVEVWVEKEALAGIVARAATALDCSYFSCRGYVSQSEMHAAAVRIRTRLEETDQSTVILYLGDHDPSGLDMPRDIRERLELFGAWTQVDRIALNYDQVGRYNPPPNFAKVHDPRFAGYQAEYGDESWELDALDPATLDALITEEAQGYITNPARFQGIHERQEHERAALQQAADNWGDVAEWLAGEPRDE